MYQIAEELHNAHNLDSSETVFHPAAQEHEVIIYGCGNIYLGDDGFGPAVIDALNTRGFLPKKALAIDAGTSIRDQLFDFLLSEELRPRQIIIVDSIDRDDRKPGEVFTIEPGSIPAKKLHDFSLHQFPTVNMLQELQEYTNVKVSIVVAQIKEPAQEVCEGLSPEVQLAVPTACSTILDLVSLTLT